MITLKIFGMNKFYWYPIFNGNKNKSLWFIEIRFICCQFIIYSREMSEEIVKHMKTYPAGLNKPI